MKSHLSRIYPRCSIVQNQEESFISDYRIPLPYKTFSPDHPSNEIYSSAMKKLFKELALSDQELWICHQEEIPCVRVYLTEPKYFLVSPCCQKCVYVEFECNLSGRIVCGQCEKQCFKFVYVSKMEDDLCGKVFKDKNDSLLAKKATVRKLISAKKHTQKKLTHVFHDKHINKQSIANGEFVVELKTKQEPPKKVVKRESRTEHWTQTQQEIKEIILKIFE